MLKMIVLWSVFIFYLIGCKGTPIAGPQVNQAILETENQPNETPNNSEKIQQLFSLLNESILLETISEFSMHTNVQKGDQTIPPNSLAIQSSTERLYTSKPNFELNGEENSEPNETKIIPQKVSFSLIPEQNIVIRDRIEEITNAPGQVTPNIKQSPLEYQSQRPSFASAPGGISGGHLSQLIPAGDPLPANPPKQNIAIHDRIKETTTTTTVQELPNQEPSTKSPLEYQSRRPTFAGAPGGISGGHLGQLIPPGNPLPLGPLEQHITIEDRIKETTATTIQELQSKQPSTKSPLEYQSRRPTFAGAPGGISGGHLGQLIPPGNPLPIGSPEQHITIEDRIKETTATTIQELQSQNPATKSPLEYQSRRPTFAGAPGGISGGHLGQLIPPGNPLPAGPPKQNITIEDRIKDTSTTTVQALPSQKQSTKSPLEYQPQRPTYAGAPGGISGGHLGQLIPPGNPWPAGPLVQNITIVDRIKETITTADQQLPNKRPSTNSPLEYQPQRPTFAGSPGGISGGHLGQLIPPGNPLPAGPPEQNITIEDRIKDTSTTTVQALPSQKPSTKSPLEYQPQRPFFAGAAGGISGGHLGQLIPPGNPLPAGPPEQNITIEDRIKDTSTTTVQALPSQKPSTKSPLEYQPQRPTYAGAPGGISGGHLGQLIPPGNPWPAGPSMQNITIVDRIKETITTAGQKLPSKRPSTNSPLEYQPQRPTFAGSPGGISGGHLGQLIPPGNPLPAGPSLQNITIVDRIKETITTAVQALPSKKPPTNSPLEYQPQRPTFAGAAGGISGGHLGQLIPPGNPLPAGPLEQSINIQDRVKETITTTAQVPLSQKPATKFPERPVTEGPITDITSTTVQSLPSLQIPTTFSVAYKPQRPSYAGQLSSGYLGQLIPPGKPWPAS